MLVTSFHGSNQFLILFSVLYCFKGRVNDENVLEATSEKSCQGHMRERESVCVCVCVPWNDLRVEEEVEGVIKDPSLLPYQMATSTCKM